MVKGQLHGMHSGSPFSKNSCVRRECPIRHVKNELIPAGAQVMSAWLINDGCDFVKFV